MKPETLSQIVRSAQSDNVVAISSLQVMQLLLEREALLSFAMYRAGHTSDGEEWSMKQLDALIEQVQK